MAKLRWVLLLIAIGIGLPAVLIVQRASEALRIEDATRHETVAERAFDEMERSLSDFLVREESRPANEFESALKETGQGALRPLPPRFANADEPFIVGWFLWPAAGDAQALAMEPEARAKIEVAMQQALSPTHTAHARDDLQDAQPKRSFDKDDVKLPAPGRTSSVGRAQRERKAKNEVALTEAEDQSTYEVLQNLNRAGSLRSERQSKALKKTGARLDAQAGYSSAQEEAAPPFAPPFGSPSATASAPSIALAEDRAEADGMADGDDIGNARDTRDTRAIATPGSLSQADLSRSPVVDPFVGRTTKEGSLVLTRSVWRGAEVERQGLVLARAALVDWIGRQVLEDTGLAERARLDFAPDQSATPPVEYRYVHRFAEPFDDLVARLELDPLPTLGAARSIPALAALLAAALILGLFAVDRMTRVVVEYAQRRSNFVAAVSHELRTPLTAIRMYAEMLRDGLVPSEEKRHEYYSTITDESERLSRLIDNVLEFSRLEQDRRDVDLVVGGLQDTIRQACEKLTQHVERENFQLDIQLDENLPRARYDRDAITQIVFNLVDNALKYARSAENKTIEIRLSPAPASPASATELRVRDFGPGAPTSELKRIFEPFYRIGEELTRTTEGTGIGLALVRELATGMGGSVRAERPAQGGLEIILTLSAADA